MRNGTVKNWAWASIVTLAVLSWSAYFLKFTPTWFILSSVVVVFFCLHRLYVALGEDDVLPPEARDRLRKRILFFGPWGAIEALLVSYGRG